jgi:putative ABC transport system ATP-binding protein
MSDAAIEITDVSFSWPKHLSPTLEMQYFRAKPQDQVFVSGPSGSGKSTFLGLLAGIVVPQSGSVAILGTAIQTLSVSERDRFRVDHIGIIFQQFNLIPYLSILENVLLPCRFSFYRRERALSQGASLQAAAESLLNSLDLSPSLWSRPATQLSIGQQQRVAAARALIGRPEIIIADEPTSALDADRQQGFLDLMQRECEQARSTLIFVSHDQRLAARFSRRIALGERECAVIDSEQS